LPIFHLLRFLFHRQRLVNISFQLQVFYWCNIILKLCFKLSVARKYNHQYIVTNSNHSAIQSINISKKLK
jgi:hypothetical protein